MGKKKNSDKKPAQTEVPKTRKQRAKMRTPKESFAGNLADRFAANKKQFDDIHAAAQRVPGFAECFKNAGDISEVVTFLNAQADANFVPTAGKSGRQAVVFEKGQQVACAPEGVAMLITQFPSQDFATAKFFVSDSYAPTRDKKKDTQLPIRLNSPALDSPFLGWVSRKFFSPVTS
jgi:hypothetical protein